MVQLAAHQYEGIRKLHSLGGRGGLFIDRGGGKTRVALMYAHLARCKRVLVVAPSYVPTVWEQENEKIGSVFRTLDLTQFPSLKKRAEAVATFGDGVLLVNYEAYWREPLRTPLLKWKPDAIILDEGHRIRHRTAKMSKFAHLLSSTAETRLLLTGTPISNGPQDVWSLFQFIKPGLLRKWSEFEQSYIIKGGYGGYEIKGYRNLDALERIITENSFQWEGDLPDPPDIPIYIRLSPERQKLYAQLKKDSIIEYETAQANHVVLAPIVLTLMLRLQQMTSGFIKDTKEVETVIGDEKAVAALEIIEDAVQEQKKVVLFALFHADLSAVEAQLTKAKIPYGRLDGNTGYAERKTLMEKFDKGNLPVMLVQLKSGSLGIDLAAASIAIFYSVNWSPDDFLQAKGRLTGQLRQRHPVTFYHLIARDTVDERIYKVITSKMDVAREITSFSRGLWLMGDDKSPEPVLVSSS